MEIQICNDCIIDSGFYAFGTVSHSEDPLTCDVCGREFWKLNVASNEPGDCTCLYLIDGKHDPECPSLKQTEREIIQKVADKHAAILAVMEAEKAKAVG